MKLSKKHIPYIAALIQTAQYSLAGFFLIGPLGWFFVGAMGALVSLAMAYAASQYNDVAERRKTASLVALIGIMLLSPILVGTATWLHLTIIANPYWRGVVSFAWGVLPDGAVVLSGFAAGKGLFDQGSKPASRSAKGSGRSAKGSNRSAKGSKNVAIVHCRYEGAGCKRTGTQAAMNAHAGKCPFKPTISMPAEIKAEKQ